MKYHYGYSDGRGKFYITIDTDKCNGCGKCVKECPKKVFEMTLDDQDRPIVKVKDDVVRSLGYVCPGNDSCTICQRACNKEVISHSW